MNYKTYQYYNNETMKLEFDLYQYEEIMIARHAYFKWSMKDILTCNGYHYTHWQVFLYHLKIRSLSSLMKIWNRLRIYAEELSWIHTLGFHVCDRWDIYIELKFEFIFMYWYGDRDRKRNKEEILLFSCNTYFVTLWYLKSIVVHLFGLVGWLVVVCYYVWE